MNEEIKNLRTMISQNKTGEAIEFLSAITADNAPFQGKVIELSAKLRGLERKENLGIIDAKASNSLRTEINASLVTLVQSIEKSDIVEEDIDSNTYLATKPSGYLTFLSYNHKDIAVAQQIKEHLEAAGIQVVIDSEKMAAGEDIKQFIETSVQSTEVTLSLISKSSLLSAWVAMESLQTFYFEKLKKSKKFIACYIENDFFDRDFTDIALDAIDEQLIKIRTLIKSRMDLNRNIRDLQNELTRMAELRNNLDEIVRRLRESLCIDLREGQFEQNILKVIEAIKGKVQID